MIKVFGRSKIAYKQEDFISLIGFTEDQLDEAKTKVSQFLAQTQTLKKVKCEEYKAKFILKYLVPTSLTAKEIPVGLAVKGPSVEVESCEYLLLNEVI